MNNKKVQSDIFNKINIYECELLITLDISRISEIHDLEKSIKTTIVKPVYEIKEIRIVQD